jgi:Tfp pilus assembly protein PilN
MRAVNLIPAQERSGASVGAGRSEGAAYGVMVVVGGVALLAFLYGRADHQISSSHAESARLSAQSQAAQAAAGQLAPYTSFVSLREQRMNAVSTLVDSRFDWAHAFHELGRVLPAQVSVSTLSGAIGAPAPGPTGAAATSTTTSVPASAASSAPGASPAAGASVTSATPPGSVPLFSLTGCATSQPTVALMLDRLRLMDGVTSVTLQSSTKATGTGGSGGCAPGQPAYSVQIAFSPIPTSAIIGSTSKATVASASAGAAKNASATGGAR